MKNTLNNLKNGCDQQNETNANLNKNRKTLKTCITIVIIISVIIIAVISGSFIIAQPAIWDKLVLGNTSAEIATSIGGMSTLIVQSASVIMLFLALTKQKEANETQYHLYLDQKLANESNIELHKSQIEDLSIKQKKLEHDIKLSMYKQLEKDFDIIIKKFETIIISEKSLCSHFLNIKGDMINDDIIKNDALYLISSFLLDFKYHVENVNNMLIEQDQKDCLIRKTNDFFYKTFSNSIYGELKDEWRYDFCLG
ncbi:hypothetical protein LJC69_06345, partial [Bacteroidales bacterium OttesenSCG-928-K22]|nr:hypothetical protein [Bacteroidales bacterium OttesenSCG-928-K22]